MPNFPEFWALQRRFIFALRATFLSCEQAKKVLLTRQMAVLQQGKYPTRPGFVDPLAALCFPAFLSCVKCPFDLITSSIESNFALAAYTGMYRALGCTFFSGLGCAHGAYISEVNSTIFAAYRGLGGGRPTTNDAT